MSKRGVFIAVVIFFGLILPIVSIVEGLEIGTNAPFFKVKSGDGKELTLDMIKGKVILIFYETKNIVEKNRKLKDELKKFYDEQSDNIKQLTVILPVINCSSAFWPFTGIWKSKLRESSKKEEIMIYGDWDGKMFSDYKMKDNESNIVIIDKKGAIRFFVSGKVEEEKIIKIKDVLKELGSEKQTTSR